MRCGSCGVSFLSCENRFVGICAKRSLSHISLAVEFFQQPSGTFVGRRMDDLSGMLSSRRLYRLQREQSRPVVGDAAVNDGSGNRRILARKAAQQRQAFPRSRLAAITLATNTLVLQPYGHRLPPRRIERRKELRLVQTRHFSLFCLFFLFQKNPPYSVYVRLQTASHLATLRTDSCRIASQSA